MMHKTELENSFLETVAENKMIKKGDKVLCAVSGGADSMCLLHLLLKFKDELGIEKIAASHVNHLIRGEEADGDEAHVRAFCKEHKIELFTLREDVPALARRLSKGIEETARQVRYGYFEKLCLENAFDKLAVAHNLTDNCETVIFNLTRGSGTEGLRGILPVRDNIIRPLIDIGKDEIRCYCDSNGIAYRFDSTNKDAAYSRNRIRNNILPELSKLNPSYEKNVRNASRTFSEDSDFIKGEALSYINENAKYGRFDRENFLKLHVSLKKRVLMLLYKDVLSNNNGVLEKIHLDSALAFIEKGDSGKHIVLPQDVKLLCEFGIYRFEKCKASDLLKGKELLEGDNEFGKLNLYLEYFSKNTPKAPDIVYTLFKQAFFDCDKIVGGVYVRTRKTGDAVVGEGMTRSLKEFFINKKIPLSERDGYPIVCDEEGIIWVPRCSVADRVKITDETKNVLTIKIEDKEEG